MKLKQLKQGDSAVPFTATDLKGNQISLSRFRGKKVYLVFFRKAACPFCNMALRELINSYDQFQQRGIEIVTLFASSANEIMKYAGKQNAPFPIIPDADYQIYDKYGIEISYAGMLKTSFHPIKVFKAMVGGFFSARTTFQDPVMPADFLIDENQEVQKAHYGKFYDDHLPVSEVLKWEPFSVVSAKAS